MNVISRVWHAALNEAAKPRTAVKGAEFENYVHRHIFPPSHYDLINRTPGYTNHRDEFMESAREPDFKFRDRKSKREFYVEAKYRSGFFEQGIDWCQYYQLKRYRAMDEDVPVFVVIGVGGTASSPEYVFLFPVRNARYTRLFFSRLQPFEIPHSRLSPRKLNDLLSAREEARQAVLTS